MPTLDRHPQFAWQVLAPWTDRRFACVRLFDVAFSGAFTPVLAKHTKSFNLIDTLNVGVGRI
jgi:hypothetical protein